MRNAFARTMTQLAEERSDVCLLSGDIGNKMFDKYKIDSLQALIFNYVTAGICSYLFIESNFSLEHVINTAWLLHAISIGILFMVVFIFYAYT